MNEDTKLYIISQHSWGRTCSWLARTFSVLICVALIALCLIPVYASAQDTGTQSEHTGIVADDDSGTVRIVVDGKTVAMFTADKFFVAGDIVHGGSMGVGGSEIEETIEKNQRNGSSDNEVQ